MDELKKQAEELGIKVDGRWSKDRIQEEIDAKLAEGQLQEVVDQSAVVQAEQVPEPQADEVVEQEGAAEEAAEVDEEEGQEEGERQSFIDPKPEVAEQPESAVITSMIENPMRAFGLNGKGSTAPVHAAQLRDKAFLAKLRRAVELGMIKGE